MHSPLEGARLCPCLCLCGQWGRGWGSANQQVNTGWEPWGGGASLGAERVCHTLGTGQGVRNLLWLCNPPGGQAHRVKSPTTKPCLSEQDVGVPSEALDPQHPPSSSPNALPPQQQPEGGLPHPPPESAKQASRCPGQGRLRVWRAFHRTPPPIFSAPAWFLPMLSSDPVTHQLLTRLPNSFFIWF